MRKRIYIAGPITIGPLEGNIRRACEAGMHLIRAGFAPMVPQLTCYMGGPVPEVLPCGTVHTDWYDSDLPWVAVSDAVLRLPGESVGADYEVALAWRLGIPVFFALVDLLNYYGSKYEAYHQPRKQGNDSRDADCPPSGGAGMGGL